MRPPSLRSRRRSPSPHWGERRRRRRAVYPFGESERAYSESHRYQRYNVAMMLCHRNFARIVVRRRGRYPNGPRPALHGARSRGTSARAIAPDRGHSRPRAAPNFLDAQKLRSVVDVAQITGEKPMESLGAINMIEITTEIALLAPSQIERHLKNRCISSFWRASDVNPLS